MSTGKQQIKVTRVRINNILGIDELEFEPGGFTEVSGRNGQGKTSVLESLRSVVRGGHDATLLRNGAEQGEIVLVLDNDMTITKRVTATKSDTSVERDGMLSKTPAATIKALADLLSVNPVDFLRAPKKDRVNVLLEAMPMPVDVQRLQELTGSDTSWLADHRHALDAIADLHKQIYDERTGVNRAVNEKKATINQLSETLPDEETLGDASELENLRLSLKEITARRDQEMERISTKLSGLRSEHEARMEEMRARHEEEREALQQRQETERNAERAAFAETERKAGTQKTKKTDEFYVEQSELESRITAAEAIQDQLSRAEQTKTTIDGMKESLETLENESKEKTDALAALEAYKAELLSSLPIPGLEVRGGEIFRDGIQFDRLNTAQQVQVAVEVAKLRAGKLGLICVDGVELLDGEAYQEFQQQALESGLQMIVARVTDDDFKVSAKK